MNGEGGPAKGRPPAPAAWQSLGNYDTDDLAGDIGAQVRRRHAAAQRCEPLKCGHGDRHRDPLSCIAEFVSPPVATYCCSSLGLEQIATLARMNRVCTATSCARLLASAS